MSSSIWNIRIRNFHIKWLKKGIRTNGINIGRLCFSVNPNYNNEWSFFALHK